MPPRKSEPVEKDTQQCIDTQSYTRALEEQCRNLEIRLRAKEMILQKQRSRIDMLEETVEELNSMVEQSGV